MQNREDLQLMVQVARLYYESEQTQQQIARRLQITRQKVSRLLGEARAEGVVRISIYDPTPSDPQLSEALCKTFRLHHVVLTSSEGLDNSQLRSHLGMAAAEFLPQMFADDQTVGIGWGRTLFYVINSLSKIKRARIHVVPLIGGIGDMAPFFQVNDLARGLADSFGGTFRNIYAPAFTPDEATWSGLVKSQEVGSVIELWDHLQCAIIGVGHVEFQQMSSMFFADHISPENLTKLESRGAVGDILGRFYNFNGDPVEINAGVIGINLQQLRAIPEVIAIAGGLEKVRALLGALRGGYVKTLVTDTATARAVLLESNGRR
ncbi:MAG TPA: sugar-binding transcriptional regulator [Longilinea sp.]|nr:sugar-binding transcriptional regulator [Longilinea sp.]